jgi:hypothetical protein
MKIRIASETSPLHLHIATLCIGKSKEQIPQGFWISFVMPVVGYILLHTGVCIYMYAYIIIHHYFLNSHNGGWSPNWAHSTRRPLLVYCTCPRCL